MSRANLSFSCRFVGLESPFGSRRTLLVSCELASSGMSPSSSLDFPLFNFDTRNTTCTTQHASCSRPQQDEASRRHPAFGERHSVVIDVTPYNACEHAGSACGNARCHNAIRCYQHSKLPRSLFLSRQQASALATLRSHRQPQVCCWTAQCLYAGLVCRRAAGYVLAVRRTHQHRPDHLVECKDPV